MLPTMVEHKTLQRIFAYTFQVMNQVPTSRERPKSASYLRLNNIQGKTQPFVKFFIYQTVPEGFSPKFENSIFCTGNIRKKTNLPTKKIEIFQKSIW